MTCHRSAESRVWRWSQRETDVILGVKAHHLQVMQPSVLFSAGDSTPWSRGVCPSGIWHALLGEAGPLLISPKATIFKQVPILSFSPLTLQRISPWKIIGVTKTFFFFANEPLRKYWLNPDDHDPASYTMICYFFSFSNVFPSHWTLLPDFFFLSSDELLAS